VTRPYAIGTALAALTLVITGLSFAEVGFRAAPVAPAEPKSMSGLHVVGNQIQNAAGDPVRLVGVNRSSAEYQCASNAGIFEGPADQAEVAAMQTWNIQAVRVVLNEDCWLGINGVLPAYSGIQYQNAIAAYVNLLTSNNLAVIINLHFNAPGSQLAKDQQPMADLDHSPAFWQSVATRFKDNSAVLFEPYNEPYPDGGKNTSEAWRCWRDGGSCAGVSFTAAGMQALVTAIRGTGATNIIIVTGNNWGSQLDQWLKYKPIDPLNQLAAGWHSYGDGLDCQDEACWNSTLKTVLQQVPIVATEIGEMDCGHGYIDRVMAFLDQQGQSYLAWSWGAFGCSEPALLTDWSGTPTQTYGQGFKNHLTGLAARSAPPPTATATATTAATATAMPTSTSTPVATATAIPPPAAPVEPSSPPAGSSTLLSFGSSLQLSLPPEESAMVFLIDTVDAPAEPPVGFQFVGAPFQLSVSIGEAGEAITTLDGPLILIYVPTADDLQPDTELSRLSVVWWDGDAWVGLPCSTEDGASVVCTTVQPGVLAIFAEEPPAPP
jgi:hypothetical protein